GAQVLAHLQILVVAEAMGGMILPDIVLGPAFRGLGYGLLPPISQAHCVSFHPAAARKTNKGRLQTSQHFRQILPQSVRTILPRFLRKQRYHVETECPGPARAD